jgi:CheY-like chemotaxis protein
MMTTAHILIVDDERLIVLDLQRRLARLGHTVIGIADSGSEAIRKAAARRPDLVFMDIHLRGDMDGIDTAAHLRAQLHLPIIFLSSCGDDETVARAQRTLPLDYLRKPFDTQSLQRALQRALGAVQP